MAGPVLLRAAHARAEDAPRSWPDLGEKSSTALRGWVLEVWRGSLADAVRDASPSLAATLDRFCAGEALSEKRVRRAVTSLVGYVLRATGRSTPFGLFAGTAFGSVASRGRVRWGTEHRVLARVDEMRMQQVVEELEAVPEVVERLRVVVDNRIRRRGDHIVLTVDGDRRELASTAPVEIALAAAETPISVAELVERVREDYPQASAARVVTLIGELLSYGFLRSNLRPVGTVTDAAGHVLAELSRCGAADVPAAADVVARLPVANGGTVSAPVRGADSSSADGLRRELRLDCDIAVPQILGLEVEAGASTLLRLSPHPQGHPVWRQYYQEFVHRYGAGVLVPLLDVVDGDMGLGYPATYPGSLMPPRSQEPLEREARLLRIAQDAAVSGADEVVLDHADVDRLTVGDLARLPPHVEVGVRVSAPSMRAIEAGDFTLRLRPARAVGTFTGRFTAAESTMAEMYRHLPTATEGAVCAQLVFPALRASAGNVARTPRFLDRVICVGEYPPDGAEVLALEDLAVLADRHQLHLVHVPSHQVVEPQVLHALSLDHQAPPLARFLAHLPRGCLASFTRFDWGAATDLPFLPRLRHGRTVLAPARWRLTTDDLPSQGADPQEWRAVLERWREKWRVPAAVELAQGDQVLPLRLDERAHTALLRRRLHAAGQAILTESDSSDGLGWVDGHAHELAVPLTTTAARASTPLNRPLVRTRDHERGHVPAAPGARWLYAKIYAHPERQNAILTDYLPGLLKQIDEPPWWFVRYRAPGDPDHLRLRLHAPEPTHAAQIAEAVGEWGETLRRDGLSPRLCLDTYFPETGRYGDGAVLEAAEAVFAADAAVLLTHLAGSDYDQRAQVAVTMVRIAAALTGSHESGLRWVIDHPAEYPSTPPSRALRQQTATLIDPHHHGLSDELEDALTRYRQLLIARPGPPLDGVISSLMHMHHNRALGVDRDSERACRHLARQAALSALARSEEAP
ncbi:lantibiotic dehydratase [Lipingzhangella sp. LS1_29]|uniref:Lantibiotic dehydratase n=1 Tax=Lipingzhangella rawalii TaxID=2055835 RepID=A0ABU2H385_9ACTN|nr:lantibiotic dehydratase [Lipingzhangella rawalii]MDS1269270.1 lantibiotic dehydratase [Lipingzhangella rawalii]